jgi:hypothetical protein
MDASTFVSNFRSAISHKAPAIHIDWTNAPKTIITAYIQDELKNAGYKRQSNCNAPQETWALK